MDERRLEKLMGQDLSEGTERFRDELLDRCLAEIASVDRRLSDDEYRLIDDDELDMLAAAGDPSFRLTLGR